MSGARAACAKLIHLPGRWGMRPAWSSTCLREGGGRGDQCQDVSLEPDSMPVTIVPSETGPSRPSGPSKIRKQLQHLDRTRLPTVPALSAWRPSPQGWSVVLEGRASPAGRRCTLPGGAPVFSAGWGRLPAPFTPLAAADSSDPWVSRSRLGGDTAVVHRVQHG